MDNTQTLGCALRAHSPSVRDETLRAQENTRDRGGSPIGSSTRYTPASLGTPQVPGCLSPLARSRRQAGIAAWTQQLRQPCKEDDEVDRRSESHQQEHAAIQTPAYFQHSGSERADTSSKRASGRSSRARRDKASSPRGHSSACHLHVEQ